MNQIQSLPDYHSIAGGERADTDADALLPYFDFSG